MPKNITGVLNVVLPLPQVAEQGVIAHHAVTVSAMAVSLKKVRAIFSGHVVHNNVPPNLGMLTPVRAGSDTIILFQGAANRVLVWEVEVGGGSITALQPYSNERGLAQAKYSPGNYQGPVRIKVSYGA
jgi:hypothetical protein